MGDRDGLEKDLETLAALLADIEKQLGSEASGAKLKEMHQLCLLELSLLKKSEMKDSDYSTGQ